MNLLNLYWENKENKDTNYLKQISTKPLLILGGGGHAKVIIDCLRYYKCNIIGITDPDKDKHTTVLMGAKVIGSDEVALNYHPDEVFLINGLGSVSKSDKRKELFKHFKDKGYYFSQVIHPSAVLSPVIKFGEGLQVMAGVIIQPGCHFGENTIINTNTSIDHDCQIGANVHIAPGVTLSGNVFIEDDVHIGSGATLVQGVHIGHGSTVGAGSLVLNNVPPDVKALGVPAKVVSK